ncbi:hypothetical protein [Rhodococcus sp. NPDC004095]
MEKQLRIYLNDQLALGVLWREMARRSERENRDTDLGAALARVSAGIAEDIETCRTMMHRLGIRENPSRPAWQWAQNDWDDSNSTDEHMAIRH